MIDPAPSRILSRMGTRRFATGAQPVVIFLNPYFEKLVGNLSYIFRKNGRIDCLYAISLEKITSSNSGVSMSSKMDALNYANTIYGFADFVRDAILPKDYNKLILPFTLLRRLECVLEPTRDAVIKSYEKNKAIWGRDSDNYCMASGRAFYNLSTYRLADLGSSNTKSNLKEYINAFSPNVREIFEQFEFDSICAKLQNYEPPLLYDVCKKFGAKDMDLSPEAVDDRTMSDIYEHLIRRFGESIAEDAEDFMTPKDVVRLAVALVMGTGEDEILSSDDGVVRTIYDPTMGTGGFITDALDYIAEVQSRKSLRVPAMVIPYGQEVLGESWAMGKTNLLIRNVADKSLDRYEQMKDLSANIYRGNTLTNDMAEGTRFDLIFSNPPFGKEWKKEQKTVEDEIKLGYAGRFGAGKPKIDDSAMLFLQHVISKMKRAEEGGAKAAIVLSASPLFVSTSLGIGPSNIRRWILQNDFVDCIVKLPTEIFYRTSIATYLWILSTRKDEGRRGKVQLIDASTFKAPLRKNQGNKRYEISQEQIDEIVRMYIDGSDHGKTVVVPYTDFFYREVTVKRPLQRVIRITDDRLAGLREKTQFRKLPEDKRSMIIGRLTTYIGKDEPWDMPETLLKELFGEKVKKKDLDIAAIADDIRSDMSSYDGSALVVRDKHGNPVADPYWTDTEDIPWGMDFEAYMDKNVRPYVPGAWIDESVIDKGNLRDGHVGVVGTEISFNRYFYRYEPPRAAEDIAKEILSDENGLEDMLKEVLK